MAIVYPDHEIENLLNERKPLPSDWRNRIKLRTKRGHDEQLLMLTGDAENEFRLILRQNQINPIDFSVILGVQVPESNQVFRLLRYNGRSHQHTNHIEDETFYNFHIHSATERYQAIGTREDAYAEPTERFGDFHSALQCMITDANFKVPLELQRNLFEGV